ncbi:MAG: hypothetical protein P8179_03275 [Candidatus Thiodiazotropha sp.]|jgi:hypothetical protein
MSGDQTEPDQKQGAIDLGTPRQREDMTTQRESTTSSISRPGESEKRINNRVPWFTNIDLATEDDWLVCLSADVTLSGHRAILCQVQQVAYVGLIGMIPANRYL